MTILDTKLVPKVKEILDRLGASVTFRVPGSITTDPANMRVTENSPTDVVVLASPPSPMSRRFESDVIEEGDVSFTIAASGLSFTPTLGMRVLHGTLTYHVVQLDPIYSGASIAAYEIRARGKQL